MDIGIFIEYGGRVIQIPVNPETFKVTTAGNNKTSEIISLGEIVIPKKKKLSSIEWKCFFPYADWYPAIRTKGDFRSSQFYVDFIEQIREDCKPCHLTVTGIDFDSDVAIETFDYEHQAGDHEDKYYTIKFKKYQPYGVSILSTETSAAAPGKPTTTVGTVAPKAKASPVAEQITVGCDVILNGRVHRDSYGSNPGKTFTNYKGKVNLINKKGSHPYHVTTPSGGWLGWVAEGSVKLS